MHLKALSLFFPIMPELSHEENKKLLINGFRNALGYGLTVFHTQDAYGKPEESKDIK